MRIVVPFPPGGATDSSARVVADFLSARYGKPFVVENRAGASGNIGAEYVARAAPDGHTWLIGSPANLAIGRLLNPQLAFDPMTDLTPLSLVFTTDHVLTVRADFPARSVAAFIEEARRRPRPLVHGSSGIGSSLHLIGEMFRLRTGLAMIHAPYRGSAPAVNDLLAGTIDCMFDQLPASVGHLRGGSLRALATTGPAPNAQLPGVPTLGETIPGFAARSWNAMAVPAGTPAPLVAQLAADLQAALADPGVLARLAPLGADYRASTPDEMRALMHAEVDLWGPVIRDAGISLS
ncbi:Bug family tripartite tricarboxylate transporter substrate binding protein [Roseomonas acroporae]|uniref:Bug family tripartite tricarboxylate transporter substrate binding protein n=1 Tax=Roseomonas acroporae TaxID=2937791 RepID=UPI00200ABC4C